MPADDARPLEHDDARPPTASSPTARYRAALRCAGLRRRRPDGHVLHACWWLFPRVLLGVLLGLTALVVQATGG
jgi:hypothetical protein